ncbi:terpenoid synthase [Penicillium desertorum]|uniref:Terpenoid synthase n=1 Tax=Penicillium desertorum TaxID=1303715 RepID=A0A9W9WIF9_9EURO|nr:terpenoid synthase [Penicillium desertorum]
MTVTTDSMFNYHGVNTQTATPSQASTKLAHVNEVKELIRQFLEDIQFDRTTPFAKDHELEAAVWNYITSRNMGKETEAAFLAKLKLGVTYVQQTYTFLPFDIRVCCGIHFLYMFLVDDIADGFMEDLQAFNQNFILNKGHNHPLLAGFDAHLRSLSRYYGQYCHSAMVKSALDYVGGAEMMVHACFPKSLFPEEKYMMKYVPVVKELVVISDFTNDILSYYKEFILADEKGNFVSNFAETHHMRQLDVLRHLTSHTPVLVHGVYRMLEGDEELLPPVRNFVSSLIMLFSSHRRYQLVELFADEQYLAPYDEDS